MNIGKIGLGILAALPLAAGIQEPIQVEGGAISGTPGWALGVREYLGVPYAAPPVGNLRWRPPQPVVAWQGVRAADRFAAACMQPPTPTTNPAWNRGLVVTSEDCLYLNVWTPAASASEKLPVMVWIHGGGLITGSTAEPLYDGNAIAKRGVVVVSLNYRLHVFGWLAHPELTRESEHHSSGNYGALDQLAAIRWVKDNIAHFGGDPNRITLWGESGGCRAIGFLLASPLTRGLVQGAIAQSHVPFGRMTTLAEAEAIGTKFCESAAKGSLAAVRSMPAQELVEKYAAAVPGSATAVVDGWFLPQDLHTVYSQGRQNDVPLLTGATNDEGGTINGSGLAGPGGVAKTLAGYTDWVRRAFGSRADAVLKLYPAANDAQARKASHDLYRDINYTDHRTWARLQAATGKAPTYLYVFSQVPPHPSGNGNNPIAEAGAIHFSDVIYSFDNLRMQDRLWTAADRKAADTLAAYWVNFARSGNPNGAGLPEWPAYNAKDESWLNIAGTARVEKLNGPGMDIIAAIEEELRTAPGGKQ